MKTGKIGVSTQDLFPIIKKFLYSDHDIFLREIVSNAVDASQKMKVIAQSGESKEAVDRLQVRIIADKTAGTLTVSDQGIGMTQEEVEKYINQIAFSGAEDFLEKYKDNGSAIIGHFGLGFYSSFMVSDKVEIRTKSYKEGSKAVRWVCEGQTEYELEEIEKAERGTDIIMYLNEEEKDFLEENKIKDLLNKYCRFLPIEIVFGKKQEWKDGKYVDTDEDLVINDTQPTWTRKPSDLKEEDYSDFYRKLYPMASDPLFHIHLNVDYPFNLTGILYFPKIEKNIEIQKNKIQLYSNQVFITDSVENIVPDYLTLLHGVIDSPDIPLNVSRSYLQSDRNVKKISGHITKKVADSLNEIFKNQRPDYEQKWDDLKVFLQYGILSDEKFAERALDLVLFKNTEGKYYTLKEYQTAISDLQTDKEKHLIHLYTTDIHEQYSYIEAAKAKGYDVLVLDGQLDTHFINYLEQKESEHRYVRVDSDVIDKLIAKEDGRVVSLSADEQSELRHIFESQTPQGEAVYHVNFEALGENAEPLTIVRAEFMRRMKEMAALNPGMNFYGAMGDHLTLVVNSDHALVKEVLDKEKIQLQADLTPLREKIQTIEKQKEELQALNKDMKESDIPASDKERLQAFDKDIQGVRDEEKQKLSTFASQEPLVGQLIDLALLANGLLKGEALSRFVRRSVGLLKNNN